jgi:hypothetical protein
MSDEPASRELMRSVLAANLQTASKPSSSDRRAARWLALLCFVGAFAMAGWLVIDGPPEPKAETAAAATTTETASAPPTSTPPASAPPAGKEATGDSGAEASGNGEGDESSAALNEEAPWVFAIVALLVGAFLAGGQSLGLGGGASPKGEAGAAAE